MSGIKQNCPVCVERCLGQISKCLGCQGRNFRYKFEVSGKKSTVRYNFEVSGESFRWSVSVGRRGHRRGINFNQSEGQFLLAPSTLKASESQFMFGAEDTEGSPVSISQMVSFCQRRGRRSRPRVILCWASRTPKRGQFLLVRWSVSLSAKDAEGFRWSVSVGRRGHRRRVSSYQSASVSLRRGRRRCSRVSLFFSSSLFCIQVYFKQSGLFFFVQVYFFELTKRDQGSNNPYPSCTQRLAPRSGA